LKGAKVKKRIWPLQEGASTFCRRTSVKGEFAGEFKGGQGETHKEAPLARIPSVD